MSALFSPRPTGLGRQLAPALLGALLAASACGAVRFGGGPGGERDSDGEKGGDEVVAVPVVTTRVAKGPIAARIFAASTIEAERQVTVHAEATGRVVDLRVEEGDPVKRHQILAKIEGDMQATGLQRARANLEKARIDYDRIRNLYRQGAATSEELDTARITLQTAQIDLKDRTRDVRSTKVRAPLAGTVTERFVSEGGYVSVGAQVVTIVDFSSLVARVFIPEKELDRVREGQPAQVEGKAARGRKGVGTVLRIAPVVDPTTGTVKVTVALPPELAGGAKGFLPGMYAEVTLTTERKEDAVLVPKSALVHEDDVAYVFTLDGDHARRTRVTLGLEGRDEVEVVEGVAPGAEIVIAGQSGLEDGALVRRVDTEGNPVESDAAAGVASAQAEVPRTTDDADPGGA